MSESLSNLGSEKVDAEERTNVTGQMTSVLDLSPINGLVIEVANMANGKVGIPVYAVLEDSNGDDLPLDTEVALRYDPPHLDQPEIVSEVLRNIRQYRTLTLTQQQNEDYRDRTRLNLEGNVLRVRDTDHLQFAIRSSEQLDWTTSRVQFSRRHVNVVSED